MGIWFPTLRDHLDIATLEDETVTLFRKRREANIQRISVMPNSTVTSCTQLRRPKNYPRRKLASRRQCQFLPAAHILISNLGIEHGLFCLIRFHGLSQTFQPNNTTVYFHARPNTSVAIILRSVAL